MNLIDQYNKMREESLKELSTVHWIESHLSYMNMPIKLSTVQKYILEANSNLINSHLPRDVGKTFALCTLAIKRICANKESVLFVANTYSSLKTIKDMVIEILRASNIHFVRASEYISIGSCRIYFYEARQIVTHARGLDVSIVLLDEITVDQNIERLFCNTQFISVGSSRN